MSKNITPFSISSPGFWGLNISDSPIGLNQNFALEANNCVIDKYGRLASRKGWTKEHTVNSDLGSADIECIGELIQNDGSTTTLAAGNNYLFKLSSTTLVTLTYGGGGVAPTITASNWYFCQLNGIALFWQRGHDPLIYDPAVSTTTYRRLSEKSGSSGTVYQCNVAISAYGRIWAADTTSDKQTVVFSDLLTPHIWTGGTAGNLDLRKVWPDGGDEVVALAAHNNFLYIFGKYQILIYSGADDPATMKLSDSIVGIGCIARDSAISIGEDVWFLSDRGLMSLQRVIQEKSAPIINLSKNVHDFLQTAITTSTMSGVKAGYSAVNNFYLLKIPSVNQTLCFDTRGRLQDGSCRVTFWSGNITNCFCETLNRNFYIGKPGFIGEYSGYLDDSSSYRMSYFTPWIDFGNQIQKSILKKILMTMIGGSNQSVIFKWAYDFVQTYFSSTTQSPESTIVEYNSGLEYNNNVEYGQSLTVNTLGVNGSSCGTVIQFGFETDINGRSVSIQKVDLFTKEGRF